MPPDPRDRFRSARIILAHIGSSLGYLEIAGRGDIEWGLCWPAFSPLPVASPEVLGWLCVGTVAVWFPIQRASLGEEAQPVALQYLSYYPGSPGA